MFMNEAKDSEIERGVARAEMCEANRAGTSKELPDNSDRPQIVRGFPVRVRSDGG
jgi:hypothetical protein